MDKIISRTKENRDKLIEAVGRSATDILAWLRFLSIYTQKKLLKGAVNFEKGKDILVDVLLVKRGRYSKHFLNISFIFLIAGAIIGGPVQLKFRIFPRFEIIDYEVTAGDTLGSIAEKFGISVDTIKWANSLKTEKLIAGQSLRIPPVTGIVHKVVAGDNIYSLGKKYKSEPQKIVNFPANDFADLDTFALNIGQILFIPDGVIPEAKPVYRAAPVPQYIAGAGGKFQWPAQGQITQYPVSYHMAVDIANRSAPPIAAGDAGSVLYAGCIRYGYGCHVVINHADGYQTLYAHLSSLSVSAGQGVGERPGDR